MAGRNGSTDTVRIYREESPISRVGVTETYEDNGTAFQTNFKTGWINVDGLMGESRLTWIGLRGEHMGTTHDLTFKLYINGDSSTPVKTKTFSSIASVTPYEFRFRAPTGGQKISTFMVEIILPGVAADGEQARFHGLSIEGEVIGGVRRQPNSRSA